MIRLIGMLILINLWYSSLNSIFGQQTVFRKIPKKNKSIQLFNGENLEGWYTFLKNKGRNNDPKQVFTVKNKLLHISGEELGCLTTNEEYDNYKLLAEYKWTGKAYHPRENKAMDGGILLHSKGSDGEVGGIWMHSIECQIIEGGTGDILVVGDGTDNFKITVTVGPEKQDNCYVFDPAGKPVTVLSGRVNWYGRDPQWKDLKGFRGENDKEKAIGQWNRIECYVRDNTIAIYLNGVLVNYAYNVNPSSGRIQLQSEGAEIVFRKIELTSLNNNRVASKYE
ncbi:MAG: hypothetical protein BGP14_09900 [Sphingobacteriales bacterium 44-15]|nr:MAG: hypothetical protein BGP14_09900 [Sphingobacteriales bacterium 44-15]